MQRRALWATIGGVTLVAVALATFLLLRADADGRPSPPCPDGWEESPEARCIRTSEACNAYFEGVAGGTYRCEADSDDGHGIVRYALAGGGRANVRVLDADNKPLYQRSVPWTSAFADDDEFRAPPGAFTLEVTWQEARGSGRIILWG